MNVVEQFCHVLNTVYQNPENESEDCMMWLLILRMVQLFDDAGATPREALQALKNLQVFLPIITTPRDTAS